MDENVTSLIMHQTTKTTTTTAATRSHQQHGTVAPPAHSRLPPDGHEFPPNFCEPADLDAMLGVDGSSTNAGHIKLNDPESRIFHEKKQAKYMDAANKNDNLTMKTTTTTTTATIATNNNSNTKNIVMTSNIEGLTTTQKTSAIAALNGNVDALPPPLPKTVPPPVTPATTAAASTTPAPTARKIYREQLVVNIEAANAVDLKPRRSSSTLSLSSTPASGSSTPTTVEFRPTLRVARKPSDWNKDEKSERSVRDKIAMFSMDDSSGSGGSAKTSIGGSTPHLNISCSSSSRNGSRKALNLSSENLLDSSDSAVFKKPTPNPTPKVQSVCSPTDYFIRPPACDMFSTRAFSMENLYAAPLSGNKLQQQQTQQHLSKYSESMQSLATMPASYASLPRRHATQSQSQIERRTSFSGGQMSDEASRRVANLLEHRRRSITKLRGLVIPERPSTLEPILDLPEIKSRDSEQTNMSDYSTDSGVGSSGSGGATVQPRATKRTDPTLMASHSGNNAYRSIFGGGGGHGNNNHSTQTRNNSSLELLPQPPAKPPRTSLGVLVTTTPMRPPALLAHDESDSDSVFSSKVSSPPMSPMSATNVSGGGHGAVSTLNNATTPSAMPEKFALTRTLSSETNTSIASSTTSTLTSGSGSQASCSSVGSTQTVDLSRRIIKPTHGSHHHSNNHIASNSHLHHQHQNHHSNNNGNANGNGDLNAAAAVAAATSRKNILASAKCRSGRGESSLLLRQRNQAPYHDDEDSTDGYDEEEVRRVAHKSRSRNNLANGGGQNAPTAATVAGVAAANSINPKNNNNSSNNSSPSTLINYKLVSNNQHAANISGNGSLHNNNGNSSLVDRVINVAAYVEVTTTTTTTTTASDTDDSSHKSDANNVTSPSKISAIFIDEERKASFKANDDAMVVLTATAKPVKTTTVKTLSAPGVANAKPVKAVIAQQAAALSAKPTPSPKKSSAMRQHDAVDASSELQQWMAKSTAKISAAAAATNKPHEKSLKPALAKYERTSIGGNVSGLNGSIAASTAVTLAKPHAKPKTSTAELRERFERGAAAASPAATTPPKPLKTSNGSSSSNFLDRFSSLDSVASSSSGVSSSTQNVSSTHEHNEFGSFSSLGSNQSLITAQDIQQIIEEADPPLKHPEAFIVVLQRDAPETSVGITLAGGANYETKEITVNKILADSPAARDGRLRKGDRILAVNGMSMRGLTHNESVSVLKTPRPEVTLVVTRSESLVVESTPKKRPALGSLTSLLEKPSSDTQLIKKETRQTYHSASRSLDIGLDSVTTPTTPETATNETKTKINNKILSTSSSSSSASSDATANDVTTNTTHRSLPQYQRINSVGEINRRDDTVADDLEATLVATDRVVTVYKDSYGMGFSLEGGYNSPLGDRPLVIKKVFYGGAAYKTGQIKPGDEIIAINNMWIDKMTRIQVWNYMGHLPLGEVQLRLASNFL